VANSLIEITAALGIHLTLVTPIAKKESISDQAIQRAEKKKNNFLGNKPSISNS
jgi:ornithine carbamoyltransferase